MEERDGLPRWEPQSVDCVVWRSEGTIVRSELVAALRQPGISSTVVTHALDAAAAALLAHRHRNEQRRRSPVVLVLVEPSTLDRCLEVVEVLQRFAAEVEFWVFQQMDGMHRLRVLRPADVERWKLELRICPGNDGHDERPARPEIRVMEEFRTPRPPKLAASPPTETPVWSEGEATPRLLSDEELRMLLAPDSREPGDGTDGST